MAHHAPPPIDISIASSVTPTVLGTEPRATLSTQPFLYFDQTLPPHTLSAPEPSPRAPTPSRPGRLLPSLCTRAIALLLPPLLSLAPSVPLPLIHRVANRATAI